MSIEAVIKKKLDSFTLDVELRGGNEVLALLGASGCGKSMTLRCIAGIVTPDEGRIVVDGEVLFDSQQKIDLPPQKRRVGLLFQNYALFPTMTVEKNIAAGLREKGDERAKVAEYIRRFRLEGLEDRLPGQLSGGQQQRVALARMLISAPRLIMLDEPFSALDSYLRWELEREVMGVISQFSGTTLLVSHNRDEVYRICDRIAVMQNGVLMQQGRPQEVYDDPSSLFVAKFLGTPPINVFQGTVRGGKLFIGNQAVLPVPGIKDREVWAAIRPEGFVLQADGPLACHLERVEVMGRDVSVISSHNACTSQTLRSIISAESRAEIDMSSAEVRFSLKPGKVFLFEKETENRLRFERS